MKDQLLRIRNHIARQFSILHKSNSDNLRLLRTTVWWIWNKTIKYFVSKFVIRRGQGFSAAIKLGSLEKTVGASIFVYWVSFYGVKLVFRSFATCFGLTIFWSSAKQRFCFIGCRSVCNQTARIWALGFLHSLMTADKPCPLLQSSLVFCQFNWYCHPTIY